MRWLSWGLCLILADARGGLVLNPTSRSRTGHLSTPSGLRKIIHWNILHESSR